MGAWLQGTGAALCVTFFVAVAELAATGSAFARALTITGAALLLAVVLLEAAFMVAVPDAARAGDLATVGMAFALSNGAFVRVFPIVPAPFLFAAIGIVLSSSTLLPRGYAMSAWILAALFEVAGLAAIFTTLGIVAAIALSILQSFWIFASAVTLWMRRT
jgi:hypothetical protein